MNRVEEVDYVSEINNDDDTAGYITQANDN